MVGELWWAVLVLLLALTACDLFGDGGTGNPTGPDGGTSDGGTADGSGQATTGEAFLKALLAPVRSGIVITRADLARAARELGLGTRMGERLYILKALLGQEPSATLAWLAREARRQAAKHREEDGFDEGVTAFWRERAAATARLLDELASAEVGTHNGETNHG